MRATSTLPLCLAVLCAAGLSLHSADADAGRVRAHGVAAGADGRAAGTVAAGQNARGAYARGHHLVGDRQGNVHGGSSAAVVGAAGGQAQRQGSFSRQADGSAAHAGSFSAQGAQGGTLASSGNIARDADGQLDGSRSTTATGRNGGSYVGATQVADGHVTHTGSCRTAAGETIACPGGR
ncbi:hypothetical protein P6166_07935 [Stenotrophomonas sp. HITSZ_GD]|uniref:hypothetical protein n=1 Tax=Stenotrophomonas sp. HITSZ_GD TaxID=3037248 RepID=UPI00240D3627|nr:hypothetical protein [Stenotrophomonas sp. HITSZ_GD]MDG2525281.1 hypothetical protein [Stenotrophomonas sp. HITSZ_GD]